VSTIHDKYFELVRDYRSSQNKFDFFFLGVILGLLSLSIQTFNTTESIHSVYLIVSTWISLVFSLIAGLFRQERMQMSNMIETDIIGMNIDERKNFLETAQANNQTIYKEVGVLWSAEEIQNSISNMGRIKILSNKREKIYAHQAQKAYQFKKWFFLFSIVLYGLYKVTNIFHISTLFEIVIIGLIVVFTIVVVKLYKRKLMKLENA